MAENSAFIIDLADLVKKHYPDGRMRVDDIVIYFGIVIAAALAGQPEAVRDRAARHLAQKIRVPDKGIGRLLK